MNNSSDDNIKDDIENSLKNELYLTNKKRPPRKFINLTPLPLNDIRKELEEDIEESNQPPKSKVEKSKEQSPEKPVRVYRNLERDFPVYPINENEIDGIDKLECNSKPLHLNSTQEHIPTIETSTNNVKNHEIVKSNTQTLLRKSMEKYKNVHFSNFKTPARNHNPHGSNNSLSTNKSNHTTQSVGKSKLNQPKIQCTIDMKTVLNTPVNRICKPVSYTPKSIVTPKKDIIKEESKLFNSTLEDNLKKIAVNGEEFLVLNELGKGGSSEVLLCYNFEKKVQRAIKCVSLENTSSFQGFVDEVTKLRQLQNCDRIIKMFDFELKKSEKVLLVVLEVGGADLGKILKEYSTDSSIHLPLFKVIQYWMEMLLAVQQIHSHGIIHADLKPANFLIVDNGLKVIDFGISTSIQTDSTSVIKPVAEGSIHYMSPEALMNEAPCPNSPSKRQDAIYKISFKSDVWSLGCILYQLVYKRSPFQQISNLWQKCAAICNPNYKIEYPEASWIPPKIIKTIKSCLQFDKKSRPVVNELISEYENAFQNL